MKKKVAAIKYVVIGTCLIVLFSITILQFDNDIRPASNLQKDRTVIELTFFSSWGGMDTKAKSLKKLIDEFEKENPGVKIINKSKGNDDFLFTLKTDFAQGNDPDVFGLWPGSDLENLIEAGKVADLTEILNNDYEWKNSFNEQDWSYDTINNKIYGLPEEKIYEGLYINKELFEQYHVQIPTTYEQLKTAIEQFNKNSIIPIAYNNTAEGTYLYQNIVAKLGGKTGTEEPFKDGKIDEAYIQAMNYMIDMFKLHAFPSNAFQLDDKGRNQLFIEKRAAMIAQGSWFIGEGSVSDFDNTVDFITFPSFNEGKADKSAMIYGCGNGNFHMSKNAYNSPEKRTAAIKFLKFLTSSKSAKTIIEGTGSLSSIKGTNNIVKNSLSSKGLNLINNSKELIGPPDSFIERSSWEDILVSKFPEMLTEKVTPESIFQEIESSD